MWWLLPALAAEQVVVPAGTYLPLYPADPADPVVSVPGFRLDTRPVTRAEFAAFVQTNPTWQRGRVPKVFADEGYLAAWTDPLTPDGRAGQPVVAVSWFAARAYCQSVGKRLPTQHEWERAARASATLEDATKDPAWAATILAWYSRPHSAQLPDAGAGQPNLWGVRDLHGLVWEWVEDYDDLLLASDAREAGDGEDLRFCGVGAASAADAEDYASFMRIAFRSSLQGRTTTRGLGFRCASDLEVR